MHCDSADTANYRTLQLYRIDNFQPADGSAPLPGTWSFQIRPETFSPPDSGAWVDPPSSLSLHPSRRRPNFSNQFAQLKRINRCHVYRIYLWRNCTVDHVPLNYPLVQFIIFLDAKMFDFSKIDSKIFIIENNCWMKIIILLKWKSKEI